METIKALEATARSLERLCNALLADINMGTLTPDVARLYLHDLETGDNSIHGTLQNHLNLIEELNSWGK